MKVDGTIDKLMVRLVIQGFRQKEGIDYFDANIVVCLGNPPNGRKNCIIIWRFRIIDLYEATRRICHVW